jgi:hypothetical protein
MDEQSVGSGGVGRTIRRPGLSAQARVGWLSLALGAATVATVGTWAGDGVQFGGGASLLWLCALVVMFALTEGFAVHVRVRRGAHAISLSEVPMVLALLAVDPVLAIVARVAGGGAGLVLLRRQRGGKLAFNLTLLGAQATVAAVTFHALGRAAAGSACGSGWPRTWRCSWPM